MKTPSAYVLPILALLGLLFTAGCGSDPEDCFGAAGQQACVYEVCDDGAGCHFEVHAQAMTKADLINLIAKKHTDRDLNPPAPPPPVKK